MDEARTLDFLAGKSHLSIAFNAEGIGLYEWLDHAVILTIKEALQTPIFRRCSNISERDAYTGRSMSI